MRRHHPALFRGRHFQDHVIVLCVRWYLRYCLTLRDLEELMIERGLSVDHSTIGRWVLRYAPELNKRIRREIRPPNGSWRVDETHVRVAVIRAYLYRAVDSTGIACICQAVPACRASEFHRQSKERLRFWDNRTVTASKESPMSLRAAFLFPLGAILLGTVAQADDQQL